MKYTFDLHIHSCLSPCGDEEMTPYNIAAMANLAGLDIIAVSDHNTTKNAPAVVKAAESFGVLAVPAMELTTMEEAHILCLLPDLISADAFCEAVYATLPDMDNDPDIFGRQRVMDESDGVIYEERRLLAGATSISVDDVVELVSEYGGVALPAHIDRPSFSVISNLGFIAPEMGFQAIEITRNCNREEIVKSNPELMGLPFIIDSDAHFLGGVLDAEYALELPEKSAAAVISAVKNGKLLGVF